MKTITSYQCETCGFVSDDRALVERCEAQKPKPITLAIGDVVHLNDSGFGWWSEDREWFLESPGDRNSSSHLERARLGYPLYVIVDIVPYSAVTGRKGEHFEAAILYSPRHANFKAGERVCWTTPSGHYSMSRVRSVSGDELAKYQARARELEPRYPLDIALA